MSPNIWRLILTGEVRVTDDFIGLCWETLGHGIHVSGHLRSPTYPNTVTDQVHPLMATAVLNVSATLNRTMCLAPLQKLLRNGTIYLTKSKMPAVWQQRKREETAVRLHCQVCQGNPPVWTFAERQPDIDGVHMKKMSSSVLFCPLQSCCLSHAPLNKTIKKPLSRLWFHWLQIWSCSILQLWSAVTWQLDQSSFMLFVTH